jgi:CBS domain-containing protein
MGERMTAGELCTRNVTVAEPTLAVHDAARLMRERHVGCLVVVETSAFGACPTGLLTDRDIVTAVVAKELDPRLLRVGDVMSADLVTVHEHDSLHDVIERMHRDGVRRVPVVGAHGVLVGLIALDDLLTVLAREFGALVQAIGGERRREQSMRP